MNIEEFIAKTPFAKKAEPLAYMDCGIIAINKGSGIMSHPNPRRERNESPSIVRAKYNFSGEYYSWEDPASGENMRLHLINRLDSPTSGVMLASADGRVAEAARAAFREKSAKKVYYAVCGGKSFVKSGDWSDLIEIRKAGAFVRGRAAESGGYKSRSHFEIERTDQNGMGLSLVRLEPLTGRTHQLRIQCAKHGLPILGDAIYGDFQLNRRFRSLFSIPRMFLHCLSTSVEFEIDGEKISFSAKAPIPESFEKALSFDGRATAKLRGM